MSCNFEKSSSIVSEAVVRLFNLTIEQLCLNIESRHSNYLASKNLNYFRNTIWDVSEFVTNIAESTTVKTNNSVLKQTK